MSGIVLPAHRIYRAVAGAVKNTTDAHPKWAFNKNMRDSIAKRATGTLLALLRQSVGGVMPSETVALITSPLSERSLARGPRPGSRKGGNAWRRFPRFRHVKALQNTLGIWVGRAKRSGDVARAETLIDVLRLIAKLEGKSPTRTRSVGTEVDTEVPLTQIHEDTK